MDIQETLKALYNELEEKAIEPQYYRYYIKDANQIIRKHFESYASQQMPSEEEREKLIIFLEWYLDNGITVYDESDESKEAVDEYLKSLQPKQKEQLKNCIGTDYGGFKGEREVKEV